MSESEVFVGFGSNLGDRSTLINQALKAVAGLPQTSIKKLSSLYETAPVGYLEQGAFLNGVVQIVTSLTASELLAHLLLIEKSLGRERVERWGPRTVDLDILFYGDQIIDEDDLVVPHSELVRRLFVLEPLCEIVPNWLHPEFCEAVSVLLNKYQQSHPLEEPCHMVSPPLDVSLSKEKVSNGIFYRYSES
ncbi:2-amino-4-hydroxy-6-hydroxymethyldihydropteridine diphosphokinase [bacterium]|nr:2-amino-4-hydroxy-6-hydroxymethyldihydropteridine diphosphokinase [bacterium]